MLCLLHFLIFKGFDYLVFKEDEQVNYFKLSTYYSFGLMLFALLF